jgi:periplasmic divalent cation tolerance protein
METGCVIVLTTVASTADARELASILVTERLAACVNVLPEMDSIYRWEGIVESERERQLVIKTTADKTEPLKVRLHQLHEYQLPELLVIPIAGGGERYLEWLRASTA